MPRTRYTLEQIITKLRQAEGELARGQSAAEGCRKLGTSEQTYSRWRKEYGGLRVDHLKRLKALELENRRLRSVRRSGPGARGGEGDRRTGWLMGGDI